MSSPRPPPAALTFEESKCAWIRARAIASFIATSFPVTAGLGGVVVPIRVTRPGAGTVDPVHIWHAQAWLLLIPPAADGAALWSRGALDCHGRRAVGEAAV